jgi:hypothetical protein
MESKFLCLLTNRWSKEEFVEWLEEIGAEVEKVSESVYLADSQYYLDVHQLEDLSAIGFDGTTEYHGVIIDGISLKPEELEAILSLNRIIALDSRTRASKKKPNLKLITEDEEDS